MKNSNDGHFLSFWWDKCDHTKSSTVLLPDLNYFFKINLFILTTVCNTTLPFLHKPMTQKSVFFLVIALWCSCFFGNLHGRFSVKSLDNRGNVLVTRVTLLPFLFMERVHKHSPYKIQSLKTLYSVVLHLLRIYRYNSSHTTTGKYKLILVTLQNKHWKIEALK